MARDAPFRLLAISHLGEDLEAAGPWASRLCAAGVEAIQLREKGLDDRDLLSLLTKVRTAIRLPEAEQEPLLLLNGRADIAAAAVADGVHLPAAGLPVAPLRRAFPRLLIGRSTHSVEEVERARQEGADYVTFGPIFETPSKAGFGPPVGLDQLAHAATVGVPVLALGGIVSLDQFRCLADHGAAGVAGIRLFATGALLDGTVKAAMEVFG